MSLKTKIQWCDSTVNLLMGCDGCELLGGHCYAESLVTRYAGHTGWPNEFTKPRSFMNRLDKAVHWSDLTGTDRPDKPWLNGKPRMIFVNDLGDTFTKSINLEIWNYPVDRMANEGSHHIWLLLTKQPKRMVEFVDAWTSKYGRSWPDNVWTGTSVTMQDNVHRAWDLQKVSALVKFISVEPMLGPIDFQPAWQDDAYPKSFCVDWLIFGGESGPRARPCDLLWILDGLYQADACHLPAFVKQLGAYSVCSNVNAVPDLDDFIDEERGRRWQPWGSLAASVRLLTEHVSGGDPSEWPECLRRFQVP